MYILKNSLLSILRNKGRNILIALIILAIACSTTVTLAIRNTASNIVKSYEEANDLIATISFDRTNSYVPFGSPLVSNIFPEFTKYASFSNSSGVEIEYVPLAKAWVSSTDSSFVIAVVSRFVTSFIKP